MSEIKGTGNWLYGYGECDPCTSGHPGLYPASTGTQVHTPEFEEATGSPDGYRAIEAAAKGMAMTAVDILSDSSKMEAVRKAFK